MIGVGLAVIGLVTAAVAGASDGGDMVGIVGAIGGGTGLSGMGLVAWHMVKGEPARRAEFAKYANEQEARAHAERTELRAAFAASEARALVLQERLLDRLEQREAGLADEVKRLRAVVSAKLGRADMTSIQKAITDDDLADR